jgi:Mn-dependent DtxR family transcriptional regulator
VEDYLAAICVLEGRDRPVIAARLAHEVGVSAPAVTEAIRRLVRAGYVRVGRGKRLRLTGRGFEVATAVVRRRRLLERWLTDVLGLDALEAHEEAHRLEHAVSPQVEPRLARLFVVPHEPEGVALLTPPLPASGDDARKLSEERLGRGSSSHPIGPRAIEEPSARAAR